MGKLVGYARVSTGDQNLQLPLTTDKASGSRGSRPGLDACLAALEPGDTLVVWRLDRLGRSMPHLVSLVEKLLGKGIGFRSLLDGAIDTTTASGELMFNIFSSLAQFERRLIQERTQAGLASARPRGRLDGRESRCRLKNAPKVMMLSKFRSAVSVSTLPIKRSMPYIIARKTKVVIPRNSRFWFRTPTQRKPTTPTAQGQKSNACLALGSWRFYLPNSRRVFSAKTPAHSFRAHARNSHAQRQFSAYSEIQCLESQEGRLGELCICSLLKKGVS